MIGIVSLYYEIPFTSGRPDPCREDTHDWLWKNTETVPHRLFMRNAGDTRKDGAVKKELFDRNIRDNYRVEFVLDDRNQMVEVWRRSG